MFSEVKREEIRVANNSKITNYFAFTAIIADFSKWSQSWLTSDVSYNFYLASIYCPLFVHCFVGINTLKTFGCWAQRCGVIWSTLLCDRQITSWMRLITGKAYDRKSFVKSIRKIRFPEWWCTRRRPKQICIPRSVRSRYIAWK